ncbi:MAG: amidohydrolase [Desulfobacterales bacterium]|jgi:omega-amidase
MPDLTVTVIQTELDWEDAAGNLRRFDRLIGALQAATDLIVLPEMFTTGFSMNAAALAESMDGRAVGWLRETARRTGAAVVGSIIAADRGRFYNRLCWASPDGSIVTYDKKHLFGYAGEDRVYTAGDAALLVGVKGWKIRPFICYDLRFPAWNRNINAAYDLSVFVANWPQRRAAHWKVLLQARAIENQCFVIGVNRIGTDGNGLYHSGDSSVIDPLGTILFRSAHAPCVFTLTLDRGLLDRYRQEFPAWQDADRLSLD